MKYLPPVRKIDLYNSGFADNDLLDRKNTGEQLSSLVETISDPFVLALDGNWGSGKTHFLKCWVGAHTIENDGTAKTVYFDAFQHDFLEDPLISLTQSIFERFDDAETSKPNWEKLKTAASKLWRPALRIGAAITTAGATEVTGVIADAAIQAGQNEVIAGVEEFWTIENSKKQAMLDFRNAINAIANPDLDPAAPQKLVIVIDELDRCRPDYALSILETIKHFFDVPNVHFVLGVNLNELKNSVRARYGSKIDAQTYLQKFVSLSMSLADHFDERGISKPVVVKYFTKTAAAMELDETLIEKMLWHFDRVPSFTPKSLRSVEKILTECALVPVGEQGLKTKVQGYQILISGLVLAKHLNPEFYSKAREGRLKMDDVKSAFGFPFEGEQADHTKMVINFIWASCVAPTTVTREDGWGNVWGPFGLDNPASTIPRVVRDYIETVKFLKPT